MEERLARLDAGVVDPRAVLAPHVINEPYPVFELENGVVLRDGFIGQDDGVFANPADGVSLGRIQTPDLALIGTM